MTLLSLGVIGFGRIAQSLLMPLLSKGRFSPESVLAVVGHKESVQPLKEKLPSGVSVFSSEDPNSFEVWQMPVQLLAIKPQQLDSL